MPEPGADSDTPNQATKTAQNHQGPCLGPSGTAWLVPGLVFGVVGHPAIYGALSAIHFFLFSTLSGLYLRVGTSPGPRSNAKRSAKIRSKLWCKKLVLSVSLSKVEKKKKERRTENAKFPLKPPYIFLFFSSHQPSIPSDSRHLPGILETYPGLLQRLEWVAGPHWPRAGSDKLAPMRQKCMVRHTSCKPPPDQVKHSQPLQTVGPSPHHNYLCQEGPGCCQRPRYHGAEYGEKDGGKKMYGRPAKLVSHRPTNPSIPSPSKQLGQVPQHDWLCREGPGCCRRPRYEGARFGWAPIQNVW